MADSLDARKAIMKQVSEGRIVDFAELGRTITDLGPQIFKEAGELSGGGEVATDYVLWGYESVVHAWHNLEATKGRLADPEILVQAMRDAGFGR
jgi:hypothetical protein